MPPVGSLVPVFMAADAVRRSGSLPQPGIVVPQLVPSRFQTSSTPHTDMLSPANVLQLLSLTTDSLVAHLPVDVSTSEAGGLWQASDPVVLAHAGAWVKLRNIGAFATCGQLQAAYHAGSKW